jgi:hypothetical protein
MTERLTMADKKYLDERWFSRLPHVKEEENIIN